MFCIMNVKKTEVVITLKQAFYKSLYSILQSLARDKWRRKNISIVAIS